jgi:hypothetical protein
MNEMVLCPSTDNMGHLTLSSAVVLPLDSVSLDNLYRINTHTRSHLTTYSTKTYELSQTVAKMIWGYAFFFCCVANYTRR